MVARLPLCTYSLQHPCSEQAFQLRHRHVRVPVRRHPGLVPQAGRPPLLRQGDPHDAPHIRTEQPFAIKCAHMCPWQVGADDTDRVDMAYRVVADHIRTLTFALTDGAHIGNNGRDYVLKRIIRRACRYGRQYFGAEPGFFSGLVSPSCTPLPLPLPVPQGNNTTLPLTLVIS